MPMKNFVTIIFLFLSFQIFSQVTEIARISFEDAGDIGFSTNPVQYDINNNTWSIVSDPQRAAWTNWPYDGDKFFEIVDLDAVLVILGGTQGVITSDNIDINEYVDVEYSFVYRVESWDTDSEIYYQLIYNTVPQSQVRIAEVTENDTDIEDSLTVEVPDNVTSLSFKFIFDGNIDGLDYAGIDKIIVSGVFIGTSPRFLSASVSADNSYIDVTYSEALYGNLGATLPVELTDFNINFEQNGGNASSLNVTSISDINNNPLIGGESVIRFHFSLNNPATGEETIEIHAAANSIFDIDANAMNTAISTGEVNVSDRAVSINSGYPKIENVFGSQINITGNLKELGTVYYVVLDDGAVAPSSAQVIAGQDGNGNPVSASRKDQIDITVANTDFTNVVTGLDYDTAYDIYITAEDGLANIQSSPNLKNVITGWEQTIAYQSFEGGADNWGYSVSHDLQTGATFIWDILTSADYNFDILPTHGSNYLMGENISSTGAFGVRVETEFDDIDISAYNSVKVSFDVEIDNLDDDDVVSYQIVLDGNAQSTTTIFDEVSGNFFRNRTIVINVDDAVNDVGLKLYNTLYDNAQYIGFDNFKIQGIDPVLPVELESFTVTKTNNNVLIRWQTLSEINNDRFEIERSNNNIDYEKIGEVKGKGNSSSKIYYTFTDNSAKLGTYYYRLKQIDIDGSFEYSQVVKLEFNKPLEFGMSQNFPNPFNPLTKIEFSLPNFSYVSIDLFNLIGQKVATIIEGDFDAGYHKAEFNASELSSGLYLYKITAGEFTQIKKMMIVK